MHSMVRLKVLGSTRRETLIPLPSVRKAEIDCNCRTKSILCDNADRRSGCKGNRVRLRVESLMQQKNGLGVKAGTVSLRNRMFFWARILRHLFGKSS